MFFLLYGIANFLWVSLFALALLFFELSILEVFIIFSEREKNQSYLIQTRKDFAAHKTLVWLAYEWRTATTTIFFKKE